MNFRLILVTLASLFIAPAAHGWETLSEGGKVVYETKAVAVYSDRSFFEERHDFRTPVLCRACLSNRHKNKVYEGLSIATITVVDVDSAAWPSHPHKTAITKTMFFCKEWHWWVREARHGACYCGWRANENFNDLAARLTAGTESDPKMIFVMPGERLLQANERQEGGTKDDYSESRVR